MNFPYNNNFNFNTVKVSNLNYVTADYFVSSSSSLINSSSLLFIRADNTIDVNTIEYASTKLSLRDFKDYVLSDAAVLTASHSLISEYAESASYADTVNPENIVDIKVNSASYADTSSITINFNNNWINTIKGIKVNSSSKADTASRASISSYTDGFTETGLNIIRNMGVNSAHQADIASFTHNLTNGCIEFVKTIVVDSSSHSLYAEHVNPDNIQDIFVNSCSYSDSSSYADTSSFTEDFTPGGYTKIINTTISSSLYADTSSFTEDFTSDGYAHIINTKVSESFYSDSSSHSYNSDSSSYSVSSSYTNLCETANSAKKLVNDDNFIVGSSLYLSIPTGSLYNRCNFLTGFDTEYFSYITFTCPSNGYYSLTYDYFLGIMLQRQSLGGYFLNDIIIPHLYVLDAFNNETSVIDKNTHIINGGYFSSVNTFINNTEYRPVMRNSCKINIVKLFKDNEYKFKVVFYPGNSSILKSCGQYFRICDYTALNTLSSLWSGGLENLSDADKYGFSPMLEIKKMGEHDVYGDFIDGYNPVVFQ